MHVGPPRVQSIAQVTLALRAAWGYNCAFMHAVLIIHDELLQCTCHYNFAIHGMHMQLLNTRPFHKMYLKLQGN